ncbi:hypothetical protein LCGC14_2141790 [marine sediment metagenome]|uniref:Uncharacterized protein n=1 Tax=marine sediment metagenome TaxID=412755 RepID=A0A0F9GUI0_9ZZZZ
MIAANGGDITGGSPKTEPAIIQYIAPVVGAKASFTVLLGSNPSNNDDVDFTTHLDNAGNLLVSPGVALVRFKSVLGAAHVIPGARGGNASVDIRIEGTIAGTLANLVAALNDPALQFVDAGPISFSATWTATNPSGNNLKIEADFETSAPNTRAGKSGDTAGLFTGNPNVFWAGGASPQAEQIISVTIQDYIFELGSSGPTVFLDGNVKDGDQTPEVLGVVTDPDGIIDQTTGITFGSVAAGTKTFRTITIPPTKDQPLTGIATVNWTWRTIPFSAQIQKI